MLLIDLYRFKSINDLHGDAAEDAVLFAVGERLRDLLGSNSLADRLGGDEFAILTDYEGEPDILARLAQDIIGALSQPIAWTQTHLEIGATIGIAVVEPETRTSDAILHAADVALYQAKREGRGTFRFFQVSLGQALLERARLETELRIGIGH